MITKSAATHALAPTSCLTGSAQRPKGVRSNDAYRGPRLSRRRFESIDSRVCQMLLPIFDPSMDTYLRTKLPFADIGGALPPILLDVLAPGECRSEYGWVYAFTGCDPSLWKNFAANPGAKHLRSLTRTAVPLRPPAVSGDSAWQGSRRRVPAYLAGLSPDGSEACVTDAHKRDSDPSLGTVLRPLQAYRDQRGYFMESWHREKLRGSGIPSEFVQDNVSESRHGVLRGLHFQWPNPQGKLVQVLRGQIFDVAIDLRIDSPTFKRWYGVNLNADDPHCFYIPEGFAHGFCVLSEVALVMYKCTRVYDGGADRCVAWNDRQLAIDWPVAAPILSAKDAAAPTLEQIAASELPHGLSVQNEVSRGGA